ncbi:hypothetical protein PRIPAC_95001, partial [Pristionchus pacificus]
SFKGLLLRRGCPSPFSSPSTPSTMGTVSSASVYAISGHKVDLSTKPLPSSVEINDEVPESYARYAALRSELNDFDVTIVVGDEKIQAHKAILSARIPFFRGLFDSMMVESAAGKVTLPNFNYPTAKALLDYIYTGRIIIDECNVEDLLMGANFLGIEPVQYACGHFMVKRLRVDNALPLLMVCKSIGYHGLDDLVHRFIDKNFVSISRTPEFLNLTVDELEGLLRRDYINVDSEKQVFDAITNWMEEIDDRSTYAKRLFKCVRCHRLTDSDMNDVSWTPWCAPIINLHELLDKAKEQRRNPSLLTSFDTKERRCDEAHNLIFAVGHLSSTQNPEESGMEFYEPIRNTWSTCQKLPTIRGRNGVAVVGRKILAIGGYNAKERLQTCDVYDTETDRWSPAPTLNQTRSAMAVGVIDDKIYVAGGFDGQHALDSMEVLNTKDNAPVWTNVMPSMGKLRGTPAACVLNGMLYVIGGHDGSNIHKDGEFFNPATKTWTAISPMKDKRCRFNAAVLNGQIYVAGGYDGAAFLREAERYDPATNTWTVLKPMNERRSRPALAVSCGKLYVFGGFDGLYNVTTVEMYDPATDTWTNRANMNAHSGCVNIGCVPIPASIPSPVANLEADDLRAEAVAV